MTGLRVTFEKLKRYCKDQGDFELITKDGDITLSFAPSFPEAQEKGDATPRRVVMSGKLNDGSVTFTKIEIEDESTLRLKDPDEAELTYRGWLDFIEANY